MGEEQASSTETPSTQFVGTPNAILSEEVLLSLYQAVILVSADNKIENVFAHTEAIFEQSREVLLGANISSLRGIGYAVEDLICRSRDDYSPLNSYDVPCMPPIGD
ncbi:MAG: hypothetical protein AB3N28_12620, partial [Kordiimonas sp.]